VDKIQVVASCELCRVCVHSGLRRFGERPFCSATNVAASGRPSPCAPVRRPSSLHHDLAGHLRVDRAVVGIGSCLGKCVGKLFIRIEHLGLEYTLGTD